MTTEQVFAKYQREVKPLNRETIEAYLAPLAGTSFERIIRRAFRLWNRMNDPINIAIAIDDDALFCTSLYHEFKSETETYPAVLQQLVEHTLAALSLPEVSFTYEVIQTLSYLRRQEVMIEEERVDTVYTDSTHEIEAFTHRVDQWRFYQKERELPGIGISVVSRILYSPEFNVYDPYPILSEGMIATRILVDKNFPLLPYIHPDRQVFKFSRRRITFSPHFSFNAAWKKSN